MFRSGSGSIDNTLSEFDGVDARPRAIILNSVGTPVASTSERVSRNVESNVKKNEYAPRIPAENLSRQTSVRIPLV